MFAQNPDQGDEEEAEKEKSAEEESDGDDDDTDFKKVATVSSKTRAPVAPKEDGVSSRVAT